MAKKVNASTIAEALGNKADELKHNLPAGPTNENNNEKVYTRKPRYKNPATVEEAFERYPKHIVKLVNLIKSNSDIRRYTSLAILNFLYQKGICTKNENGKIGYITFHWSKFRVNNNGLSTEYRYTEPLFLNCLIASFTSFANGAQKIIKDFCDKEVDNFNSDETIINEAIEVADNADDSGEE